MIKALTKKTIERKIKEGRGQGTGADYIPFYKTNEVSSHGRSSRVRGCTTNRIHHLLSDIELATFLIFDWHSRTTDIREQFLLCPDDVKNICKQLLIKQREQNGVIQPLTTDFVINFNDPKTPKIAIQVKPSNSLSKASVIQRLQIEKAYFEYKKIPWYIITDRDIHKSVITNIKSIYHANFIDINENDLYSFFEIFITCFKNYPDLRLTQITQKIDTAYDLDAGEALLYLKALLAKRYFNFDYSKKFNTLFPKDISINQILGEAHV